mgnify:CR=1 FL=1
MDKKTQKTMFSSKTSDWGTPEDFFRKLNNRFGPFTLDAAANDSNYKVENYITEADDAFSQDWSGNTVFLNPPYGRGLKNWICKAYEEGRKDNTVVVMLIPARTDTNYWHNYVMKAQEIYFVHGRLKFGDSSNSTPFPSAVIVFYKIPTWAAPKPYVSTMER